MSIPQKTVARPAAFSGIALHSGRFVRVRVLPHPENGGIVFCRTDIGGEVSANANNVRDTRLATTLANGKCEISTVEHFLSALSALAIDNLRVEVDGPELPILDGSAAPWMVFLTEACGIAAQNAPRKQIRVLKTIEQKTADGYACFSAAINNVVRYEAEINFPHLAVRRTGRSYTHILSAAEYEEEISRARTFCYVNDVEAMRKNRRALGGSLLCAVVYDDFGVLNEGGLRYPDEFVRHKILDAVGDCYINGHLIVADYKAECPGHGLNLALVSALLTDKSAWEWM